MLILRNLWPAFKATFVPFAVLAGAAGLLIWLRRDALANFPMGPESMQTALLLILILLPLVVFVLSWVAVTWHRFVLLEEEPGFFPALKNRPVWRYVWRLLQVGLIYVVFFFIMSFISSLIVLPLVQLTGSFFIITTLWSILINIIIGIIWFRLALVLPAASVGKPITISESVDATSDIGRTLIGVIIILSVLQIGLSYAIQSISFMSLSVADILSLVLQWFTLLLGISMLTTLYGHLVEGRDLPQ
ncbi:hypothetical protein AB3Y40_15965 [Yoonia sp. R2331]|uniref:hypothetical protein n=1 Tax=Yoonia sp. R2331 TaxID=3237238 RepID=UPI0034E5E289